MALVPPIGNEAIHLLSEQRDPKTESLLSELKNTCMETEMIKVCDCSNVQTFCQDTVYCDEKLLPEDSHFVFLIVFNDSATIFFLKAKCFFKVTGEFYYTF